MLTEAEAHPSKALVDLATAFDLDSGEAALTKIEEEGILFDIAVLFIDDLCEMTFQPGGYWDCDEQMI